MIENMESHGSDDLNWKPIETFEESVDASEMFFTSLIENPDRFEELPEDESLHMHTEAFGADKFGIVRAVILNLYSGMKRGFGIVKVPEKKQRVLVEA